MNIVIRKLLGLSLLFWLVAAHALTGAPKAHAAWEAEWKKTVEAAKKEGQVTIYTSSRQNHLLLDSGAFQKRYPEIKTLIAPRRLSKVRFQIQNLPNRLGFNLHPFGLIESIRIRTAVIWM